MKTPSQQGKSILTSGSSKAWNFLGMCCMLLPGLSDRSEFPSAAVSHMPVWKTMFLSCVACSWDCTLYSGDCSQPSECKNCLMQ